MIDYWRMFHGQTCNTAAAEETGGSGGSGGSSGRSDGGSGGDGNQSGAGDSASGSGSDSNGSGAGSDGSNQNDASSSEAGSGAVSKEDFEKLQGSYKELKTSFNSKTEDLKKQIKEDFLKDQEKKRPETNADYLLERDGLTPEELSQSPMLNWFKQFAWENNMSQDAFKEGAEAYFKELEANLPDEKAEMEKLGENGKPRKEQVQAFLNKHMTEESDKAVLNMLVGTAGGVRAVESLMRATGVNPAQHAESLGHYSSENVTLEEIRKLQASPEYYSSAHQDPEVVKKVNDYFASKFKPA